MEGNNRPLSPEEKKEYEQLLEDAAHLELRKEQILSAPKTFGYARVSSRGQAKDGNSLESQKALLMAQGASEDTIFTDVYTGTTTDRPELEKLLRILQPGDTLIVTKLDRISRSVQQGISLLDELAGRGIRVNVLNMGILDDSPTGKLTRNLMLAFAEFERDMIMQRTREGKEIAKTKAGYHEGRKYKFTEEQLRHAVELLKDKSYSQVAKMTGISKSTLIKAKKKFGGER